MMTTLEPEQKPRSNGRQDVWGHGELTQFGTHTPYPLG